MIKVILLDIDGTLTNSKKEITPKTKEALMKAQENGARIVLASGRPTKGLMKFAEELDMMHHHGLFISYNGSQVYDCESKEVIFNQALTVEEGKAVLHHMKNFDRVRPMIDKGDDMYVSDMSDNIIQFEGKDFDVFAYESGGGGFTLKEAGDLEAFCDWEINKILTTADPEYLQEHYEAMAEPFKETLSCMFTGPFYYEFTAKGIDKAKAMEAALLPLGYTKEEMIAFGDGQNDKTMLMYAGTGVAMSNAVDELKEIADEITLSNEEDGIAYSLYKHMPEIFQ